MCVQGSEEHATNIQHTHCYQRLSLSRIYAINDSTYYVTYSNYQGLEICRSIVFAPQKQMWWKTDYGLDIQHKKNISTQSQKFSSSIVRMNSGWFFDMISFYLIWFIWVAYVPWLFMPIQSKPPAKWETRVLSRLHTGGNPGVRLRIFIRGCYFWICAVDYF